jgi:hypothetical protein
MKDSSWNPFAEPAADNKTSTWLMRESTRQEVRRKIAPASIYVANNKKVVSMETTFLLFRTRPFD